MTCPSSAPCSQHPSKTETLGNPVLAFASKNPHLGTTADFPKYTISNEAISTWGQELSR